MSQQKPYVLSIAGFDPSAGAGVLADVKALEQIGAYGFGVVTALTWQNDIKFEKVEWIDVYKIISQIDVLLQRFDIKHIKIGLIESASVLMTIVRYLHDNIHQPVIVYDPVFKASAGFVFHNWSQEEINDVFLSGIYCITPNRPEAKVLYGNAFTEKQLNYERTLRNVYLKGGHSEGNIATDILYSNTGQYTYSNPRLPNGEKHGSGCVLSAAIAGYLALGNTIQMAAKQANKYVHNFLASNDSLLGYHNMET